MLIQSPQNLSRHPRPSIVPDAWALRVFTRSLPSYANVSILCRQIELSGRQITDEARHALLTHFPASAERKVVEFIIGSASDFGFVEGGYRDEIDAVAADLGCGTCGMLLGARFAAAYEGQELREKVIVAGEPFPGRDARPNYFELACGHSGHQLDAVPEPSDGFWSSHQLLMYLKNT